MTITQQHAMSNISPTCQGGDINLSPLMFAAGPTRAKPPQPRLPEPAPPPPAQQNTQPAQPPAQQQQRNVIEMLS